MCVCGGLEVVAAVAVGAAVVKGCRRCKKALEKHVPFGAPDREPGTCQGFAPPDEMELNPGSDAALALGCQCPVMDNGHGRGSSWGPGKFWINAECPLHGGKGEK